MELFFRDNHAPDEMTFCDTTTEVSCWLKTAIGSLYTQYFDFEQVKEIEGSNINSGNYKVDSYYIKTIRHLNDKSYVSNFPSITDALKSLNVPVGHFIKNSCGDAISSYFCKTSNNQYYMYIQSFTDGHFFSGSRDEMLSCLHYLPSTSNLQITNSAIEYRNPYQNWHPEEIINNANSIIRNKSLLDGFDQKVAPFLGELRSEINEYQALRQYLSNHGNTLNHCDLHPHNLLFSGGDLCSIIDLESFVNISPELSAAFAFFKLGRKSVYTGAFTCNELKAVALDYHLNLKELYPFIDLELIRRFCLILDLHYRKSIYDWDSDIDKQLIGRLEIKKMFL